MCITASQMQWTADVTKALGLTKERGDKKALKSLKKKQVLSLTVSTFHLLTISLPGSEPVSAGVFDYVIYIYINMVN